MLLFETIRLWLLLLWSELVHGSTSISDLELIPRNDFKFEELDLLSFRVFFVFNFSIALKILDQIVAVTCWY